MLLKEFSEKVEAVRRFRAGEASGTPRVLKALGAGYRVTIPFANETETFMLKGPEVERILAQFPGVVGLCNLFADEPTGTLADGRDTSSAPVVGSKPIAPLA